MAKLKQTFFVIVASPQQQVAPRTCYIAQDGSITMLSSKAVKFSSLADAIEFAEEKRIVLNALTYIDLKDFTDLEMQG